MHATTTTCIHCNCSGISRAGKRSPRVVHLVTLTYRSLSMLLRLFAMYIVEKVTKLTCNTFDRHGSVAPWPGSACKENKHEQRFFDSVTLQVTQQTTSNKSFDLPVVVEVTLTAPVAAFQFNFPPHGASVLYFLPFAVMNATSKAKRLKFKSFLLCILPAALGGIFDAP